MTKERRDLYLTILERAILDIRYLACQPNMQQACYLEAMHVHNIPHMLREYDIKKEGYYWEVERVSYMQEAGPSAYVKFEDLWRQLGPPNTD